MDMPPPNRTVDDTSSHGARNRRTARRFRGVRLCGVALIVLVLLLGGGSVAPLQATAAEECFPQTGKCVGDPFYQYWLANGGLRQQGYPTSDEFDEVSPTNGLTYRVQYFERARFELDPENADPAYQVLIGLLGREQFLSRYPQGEFATFRPIADARVDGSDPDRNFGAENYLAADGDPVRASYLRFDVRGLGSNVASARLRVYCPPDILGSASPDGGIVARVSDTSWAEDRITYRNRPPINGQPLATLGAVQPGQWYEFDVTAAVTGNGLVNLGLRSENYNAARYSSREEYGHSPYLIVTFAR